MAKQQTDDELNLRRKARRRLIGAVALTLAVVVILPMVLDSEPKISGKDIDLSIPDPNRAGKFVPRVVVSDVGIAVSRFCSGGSSRCCACPDPMRRNRLPHRPSKRRKCRPSAQPAAQKSAETGNTAKPASAEGFVAQVGAYSNQDTAKQELEEAETMGLQGLY